MAGEAIEVSTKEEVDTKRQPASGSPKRRQWPEALKRQIVAETLEPGASVSVVARRHDVNTNQVFTWRRELLPRKSPAVVDNPMVPVSVVPEPERRRERVRHGTGVIEIAFGDGVRVLRSATHPLREIVRSVDFGGKPIEPPKLDDKGEEIGGGPYNRRAEMWLASRDWLQEPGGASIPDSDVLQQDATAPGYKWRESGGVTRLVLESKEDIRKRGAPSPDEWDAVALTFAEPVVSEAWSKPLDYSRVNLVFADTLESLARLRQQRERRIV